MIAQYPHTLVVSILTEEAQRDELGNYLPDEEATVTDFPCRAEPNGNRVITLTDGQQYTFSYLVYMAQNVSDIPFGAQVQVRDTLSGKQITSGTVKQFSRGQLNCRLWL